MSRAARQRRILPQHSALQQGGDLIVRIAQALAQYFPVVLAEHRHPRWNTGRGLRHMERSLGQGNRTEIGNLYGIHHAAALELRMIDRLGDGQHWSGNQSRVAEEVDSLLPGLEVLLD